MVRLRSPQEEPGEKHRLEPFFDFGERKFFNHKVEK